MTQIKMENVPWHNGRKPFGSKWPVKKGGGGFRKPWVPYEQWKRERAQRRFPRSGPIYSQPAIVASVLRELKTKPMGAASRVPKNNEVYSNPLSIVLQQGHGTDTVTFLPVTWAIPQERRHNDPPDDRFREHSDTFLTGVRVRFTVRYTDAFRIRMALYRSTTKHMTHPFTQASLAGATLLHPPQAFSVDWLTASHAHVVANGPFEHTNINRVDNGVSSADNGDAVWAINSSDGTIFGADLAKGSRRPLATYQLQRNGGNGTGSFDVDWWVPIKKVINFQSEITGNTWDQVYQILFYYDCPIVTHRPAPIDIGFIPRISVKVYYR